MTTSIVLQDREEAIIAEQLASGRYKTSGEVVQDALRLLEEREQRRASFDAAIERGLADADAGRVTPIEDVAKQLIARYDAMAEERGM